MLVNVLNYYNFIINQFSISIYFVVIVVCDAFIVTLHATLRKRIKERKKKKFFCFLHVLLNRFKSDFYFQSSYFLRIELSAYEYK